MSLYLLYKCVRIFTVATNKRPYCILCNLYFLSTLPLYADLHSRHSHHMTTPYLYNLHFARFIILLFCSWGGPKGRNYTAIYVKYCCCVCGYLSAQTIMRRELFKQFCWQIMCFKVIWKQIFCKFININLIESLYLLYIWCFTRRSRM